MLNGRGRRTAKTRVTSERSRVVTTTIGWVGIVVLAFSSANAVVATESRPARPRDTNDFIHRRIVTSDNPPNGGGHLATGSSAVLLPGMPSALNPAGVVSLVDSTAGVFCSGALIGDRHVLTSAHCVEAASIYTLDRVSFDTTTGLTSVSIADLFLHPSYDGSLENGHDIAVLQLASSPPVDAPRYGLYTATDELGRVTVKAGHGRSGHGSRGTSSFDAVRRVGLNTYDATSIEFNHAFGTSMASEAYILYDFDSGQPDNDAWGLHGVESDLGFGVDEVNAVSGDSGGPTFVHDGTDWLIGGVTAWGAGLATDPPDVTPTITDGSWGEISADTRVSSYADFVLAVLDGTFVRPRQHAYSHGIVNPNARWHRPQADGAARSDGPPVPFHAFTYTVDTTGEYKAESIHNFDGLVHVYEGLLDPTAPLDGLIAGDSDGSEDPGTSNVDDVMLSAGATYTLVTSAKTPSDVGTFLNTITGPGQVTPVAPTNGGFAGTFAPMHWQFNTDHAEARVRLDDIPSAVTIFGGDDWSGGDTSVTTVIKQGLVTVDFDWTYFSQDDPGFDVFGILLNGDFTRLTDGTDVFGSYNLLLRAGDEFGFQVHTVDGVRGAGIANIYNLDVDISGDLNNDGLLDADDVTLLFAKLREGDSIADVNQDGSVDTLDRDAWVRELKLTWYGDADLDGEFTSSDLIAVFRAAKYDSDTQAQWHEGDWTGDGSFDSTDLILALQDGGYELGPRPSVLAVPEPSDVAIVTIAALIVMSSTRGRRGRF